MAIISAPIQDATTQLCGSSHISKPPVRRRFLSRRYASWLLIAIVLGAGLYGIKAHRDASYATALFELRNDRILPEALISERPPSSEEVATLEKALLDYRNGGKSEAVRPIVAYLTEHPDSPWRVSLRTNLGLVYYQTGYFSRALEAWKHAWREGKDAQAPEQRAIADRAFGELVRMHARLGHASELRALLAELGDRKLMGAAGEAVAGAREGLWMMEHKPGVAYLCGPMALKSLLSLRPPNMLAMSRVDAERSGPLGVSLARVASLAAELGMPLKAARREGRAEIPVPSVVHWKVNHYAAIVGKANGRYQIKDPTFGRDLWMSADAINAESSGYFMVSADLLGYGWRAADSMAAESVRGMGYTGSLDPGATRPDDEKECDDGCASAADAKGMPQYAVHSMLVSLNIQDVPVGYAPPKGPPIQFLLTYNQREANQPANPTYSNVGSQWTYNWLSYVQDDPAQAGATVSLAVAGGGTEYYGGYDPATGKFAPETRSGAELLRVQIGGGSVRYERRFSDGSVHVYGKPDNATFFPRRVFLTEIRDPAGNKATLSYDAQSRLSTIRDALAQLTTFAYEDPANALHITKVTDPFGRFATLGYDASGRLNQITDLINMTSSFSYLGTGSFINSMTTPYGTTQFAYADESGTARWLEITDPLGHGERVETRHVASGIPYSESIVPAGINTFNSFIDGRNTFYWDKDALALGRGDYTKARIKHWLHDRYNIQVTAPVLESTKDPLENRVWFNYPGQSAAHNSGTLDKPSAVARVMDDGSTQVSRSEYNAIGRITKSIDAIGREVLYDYAPNGIDLLQVRRKNGAIYNVIATYSNYNTLHQPGSYTDAAGQITTYQYNAAGQPTLVKNPLLQTQTYEYDSNGYLKIVRNANGVAVQTYTYDAFGRTASLTDSEGHQRRFEYDALDRITKVIYPDTTYEEYTYTKLDRTRMRDRLGRSTDYVYNAERQLEQVDEPLPRTIFYDWTPAGRLSKLTDGENHATQWEYDIQGRRTAEVFADDSRVTYSYDLAGRLRTVRDALQQVKTYTYTPDDKLSGIGYANAINPTASIGFAYDPVYPRRTAMNDGIGNTLYAYKPVGTFGALQVAQEDGPYANDVLTYTYDALGRLATRAIDGQAQSLTYDAIDRVESKTNALGYFEFGYLGQTNQLQSRNSAVGPVLINAYDDNLRDRVLRSVGYYEEMGTIPVLEATQEYHYGRDVIGKITSIDEFPGGQAMFAKRWNLGYDATDRLRTFTGLASEPTYTYEYDRAGNRPSANLNGTAQTASHNNLNQLAALDAQPHQYDLNGNLLNDGSNTYYWDAENRLTKVVAVTPAGKQSVFGYDGLGRRLLIKDTASASHIPVERRYVWCGQQPCQERDGRNRRLTLYFDEGELQGSNKVLYLRDQLGSVRQLQDITSSGEGSYDYGPYGEPQASSGTVTSRYRYAGMFHHPATGFYLTWYRPYQPQTGRWLSRDPIGVAGGINLYAYVEGNPISKIDPLGLEAIFPAPVAFPAIPAWLGPAAGLGLAGYGGWQFGSAIYPHIAIPLGDAIDAVCADSDEERCQKVRTSCIQGCSDFVLQKPRGRRTDWGSGADFDRCVRQCLDRNGC